MTVVRSLIVKRDNLLGELNALQNAKVKTAFIEAQIEKKRAELFKVLDQIEANNNA